MLKLNSGICKELANKVAAFANGKNKVKLSSTEMTNGANRVCTVTVVNEGFQIDHGFMAEIDEINSWYMDASSFATVVAKLAQYDADILIEFEESNAKFVTQGVTLYVPLALESEAEPNLGSENFQNVADFSLPGKDFVTLLKKVAKFSGRNDKVQNVALRIANNELFGSSCDSHAGVVSSIPLAQCNLDLTLIAQYFLAEKAKKETDIAAKVTSITTKEELLSFAKEKGFDDIYTFYVTPKTVAYITKLVSDEPVKLIVGMDFLYVNIGYTRFTATLGSPVMDIFMIGNGIHNENASGVTVTLDREAFIKSLDTVTLLVDDKTSPVLKLSNNGVTLSCGNNSSNLSPINEINGELSFAFTTSLMNDVLSTMNSGNVTFSFKPGTPDKAPLAVNDDKSKGFLLPVLNASAS